MQFITKEQTDALEAMIDRYGLEQILNTVAGICAEKADHIRGNWQDCDLAAQWDKLGTLVSLTADSATDL